MSRFGISKKLSCGFEQALANVKAALEKEGLGIITEIDAADIFRQKLNKNFNKYHIIGACSPQLVFQALTIEPEMGMFLPCNIIIYEDDRAGVTVSAIDPVIITGMVDNPALSIVAKEVRDKFERILSSLSC